VALPQIVSRDIGFAQEHEALQRRMPRHRSFRIGGVGAL
jgi:hypothetical protein